MANEELKKSEDVIETKEEIIDDTLVLDSEEKNEDEIDEIPEEAAVPADAGEMERTPASAEAEKNVTLNPNQRRGNARQARTAVRNVREEGTKSNEIVEKENREKSDKELADEVYRRLESLRRTGRIAWGEIFGVEPSDVLAGSGSKFCIAAQFNGAKILIPESEYFEDTFLFGSDYDRMSESEKTDRRAATARYQIGARICFVVKGVIRDIVAEGEFAGTTRVTAVASRKEAMKELRDVYFIHSHNPANASHTVDVGTIANAHVIGVREAYALVECLGVETRVEAYLLNDEFVENCTDFVRPGDSFKARVRTISVNPDGSVYLTVSGRLNETSKNILDIKQNGTYQGKVDHYNSRSNTYTIRLKNGVSASVRADSDHVNGGVELMNGDDVSVLVTRITPTFVIGKAKKI